MSCISIEHISKQFYGISVLEDVSIFIDNAEIHGLIGENGAGKSTLMNIISGLVPRDQGKVLIDGVECVFSHPIEAEHSGVIHIHQELNILPELSVVENLFLGNELHKFGFLDNAKMNAIAKDVFSRLGQDFDIQELAGNLSMGHQQIVEIAKSLLHHNVKLIILDEPTSSLTENETAKLFDTMTLLKQKEQVSIVYVSHKLPELFHICDKITVLRDGRCIATKATKDTNIDEIISMMIGRKIEDQYMIRETNRSESATVTTEKVLEVKNLSKNHKFQDISFELYKGEILGFSGLIGAGRTEVMHAIFGTYPVDSGSIVFDSKTYTHGSPSNSIKKGIGFLSEDRKTEGILENFSVASNISISNYDSISTLGFISEKKEFTLVDKLVLQLSVKVTNYQNSILTLSGGNQQKALFARNLNTDLKLLILDEPTRGVDVGAKRDIYQIMRDLTHQGIAIIVVSSDLLEVLSISDRIAVMHEGSLVSIVKRAQANQDLLMHLSTNSKNKTANSLTQTSKNKNARKKVALHE